MSVVTSVEVIEQLEANKKAIAHKIAQVMVEHQIQPYANFPILQIQQGVVPSIDMVLTYFRTDDSTALKAEIQKRASDRVKGGYPADDLQKAIGIIADVIGQAIDSITSAEVNPNITTKYKSRLESIKALSKISVVNYQLKENG